MTRAAFAELRKSAFAQLFGSACMSRKVEETQSDTQTVCFKNVRAMLGPARSKCLIIKMAGRQGFEPRYADPESAGAVDSKADQLTLAKRVKSEQNTQPPRNQNPTKQQQPGPPEGDQE